MHAAKAGLAISLAMLCGACALPQSAVTLGGAQPDVGWDSSWPTYPGYSRSYYRDDEVVCDRYGRCWRYDDDHEHDRYRTARPPDWAEELPDSEQERRRFVRPDDNLVCDQATRVCYKRGLVDKSDTKEFFGRRAAKHADRLRDERGNAEIFIPEKGVACDPGRQRCYADGKPDRDLTRRHFGKSKGRDGPWGG
jgi:hypothetical protein